MKLSFEGSSFKKKIIHKTNKMYLKDRKADLSIPLKHLVSPQLFYCDPVVFLQPLTLTVMQLKALDKHIFVLYCSLLRQLPVKTNQEKGISPFFLTSFWSCS